jgi:hypothetical protein
VDRVWHNQRGLHISAVGRVAGIPLDLPQSFLPEPAFNLTTFIGRWVECEVILVDKAKRAVVVRPVTWLDTVDERRQSIERTDEFWRRQPLSADKPNEPI